MAHLLYTYRAGCSYRVSSGNLEASASLLFHGCPEDRLARERLQRLRALDQAAPEPATRLMHIDIPGVDVRANDKGLKERLRFQANVSILLSQPVAADPMRSGSISSVEASGVLSPEEPANRAAPQPPKRRKLLKSSGQTKEIWTSHFFLQEAITSAATIPFSFRIGLRPIGFRRVLDERKVAAASGKDVLGRTDPPGPLLALES